jgi:hypothetical protein
VLILEKSQRGYPYAPFLKRRYFFFKKLESILETFFVSNIDLLNLNNMPLHFYIILLSKIQEL